ELMQTIHGGLVPGGGLILIEKVKAETDAFDAAFVDLHHAMKRDKGYSHLEIARKREALDEVLIPWKLSENLELLRGSGFRSAEVFFKWNNFAGLVALK
ncbi:MAG: tRNA (cmo5U34)-methyltransferase, partial [Nitrospinae bacterium CG11_big_fil_rev_8_21_14_0_20_56_8]